MVPYKKLISISGMSGLFQLISTKTDGAIVKSLEDSTTKFVSSRQNSFAQIEGIEIFTINQNVNLIEIFRAMDASSESIPNEKDNKAVQAYFEKVYPDLDFERVYASDRKKIIKWFLNIKAIGVSLKEEKDTNEDETPSAETITE